MSTPHNEAPSASSSSTGPVFTPHCPQCQYELVGLPDGACPECGTAFSFDSLLAEHVAAKSNASIAMDVLRPCVWMAYVLAVSCAGFAEPGFQTGTSVLWFLAASALFVFRAYLFASRVATLLVAGLGLAAITVVATSAPWKGASNTAGLWAPWQHAVLSMALCLPALIVGRWRWMLWAWGSIVLGSGAVVVVSSIHGIRLGQHWSPWSDPRWWDPYRQYPLSHHAALWFGVAWCLPGVVLLMTVRRIYTPPTTPLSRSSAISSQ